MDTVVATKKAGRPKYTAEEKAAAQARKIALAQAKKAAAKIVKLQVDASLVGQPVVAPADQTLAILFEQISIMRTEINELRALIAQGQTQPQPN